MKLRLLLMLFVTGCLAASAHAQVIVQPTTVYYPPAVPAPAVPAPAVAAPVVASSPVTVYKPAPVVYSAPAPVPAPAVTVVARPVVPAAPVVSYRPVVPVAVPARPVVVGRGLLGQPEAYVPGQPIRNALRFISP